MRQQSLFLSFVSFTVLIIGLSLVSATNQRCASLSDFTTNDEVFITLGIDDYLPINPVDTTMDGWYAMYPEHKVEAYWRKGLIYLRDRFGLDFTDQPFPSETGTSFLFTNPQTPYMPTVVLSPLRFTGAGTYRVLHSSESRLDDSKRRPDSVVLNEYIVTFLSPFNLTGTYAQERGVDVVTVDNGDGLAFGRYTICGYQFDMRSWVHSKSWLSTGQFGYFTERFQIGSLQTNKFPHGSGQLAIINTMTANDQGKYAWYIRNDWHLGHTTTYAFMHNWNIVCGESCDTTLIR